MLTPKALNGLFQVHSYDSNLVVEISEATVGTYICRASVRGFKEISSSAEILMRGPPRVLRKDQTQFGRLGANVEVRKSTILVLLKFSHKNIAFAVDL